MTVNTLTRKEEGKKICAAIIITGAGEEEEEEMEEGEEGDGDVDRNTKLVQRRQLGKGLVASCLNQR